MSKKTLTVVSVLMVVVFGLTILLYPMLFNPDADSAAPVEAPPAAVTPAPTGLE